MPNRILFGRPILRQCFVFAVLLATTAGFWIPHAFPQTNGTVKGVCRDSNGRPIVGGEVEWRQKAKYVGQKYTLLTNRNGEYFSLGIEPGAYTVTLRKDGRELSRIDGVSVGPGETTQDINVDKEQEVEGQNKTSEASATASAHERAVNTVRVLNQKLAEAKSASDSGNFDAALAILNEANAIDDSHDLIWAKLGDAYRMSAETQPNPDEKARRYQLAIADFHKAIQLRTASPQVQNNPDNNRTLAAYYSNLGSALAKELRTDEAIDSFKMAVQLDPDHATTYYFNQGAVYANSRRDDDALTAFDKAIAADPTNAPAYYYKGVTLAGKATLNGNKLVLPEGTAEALRKYLELDPNGPMASTAKSLLASVGTNVETDFAKGQRSAKSMVTVPPVSRQTSAENHPDETTRGFGAVGGNATSAAAFLSGHSYALLIGNNRYTDFPQLSTAEADANAVASALENGFGFQVRVLLNATRHDIIAALAKYRVELPEDANLLIYFAGHGYFDKEASKAYWLPVDAERSNPANWIIADDITTTIRTMSARHVLIVSDSCYSGGLTRDAGQVFNPQERSKYLVKMSIGKSRTLLASGGIEPVADAGGRSGHSVFASALLDGFRRMETDTFTAEELFSAYVLRQVAGHSDQAPQYTFIRDSGDDSGDFVFVRRR